MSEYLPVQFTPHDLAKKLRALSPEMLSPSPQFPDAVACSAEVFDFGELDFAFIWTEMTRGKEPFLERLVRVPFPVCMLRFRVSEHGQTYYEMALAVRDLDTDCVELALYNITQGHLIAWFNFVPSRKSMQYCRRLPSGAGEVAAKENACTGVHLLAGLLMILNTRGIRLEVREPSAEHNRRRRRQGKPPIKRVTRVDVRHYMEAVKNANRGGTHASPVPHRRRGHIRREHMWCGQLRPAKWIPDCIVNVRTLDEEVQPRTNYKVVHSTPPGGQEPGRESANP
jgi:hypothetical protein